MLKITVVAVGKVKENYFLDGIKEYSKRLSRFCDFKIVEVAEESMMKPSLSEEKIIKKREAERILPYLKGKIVAMAIEGKKFTSEKFSAFINNVSICDSDLTFVIGGSYGLDESIKSRAELISFSDMTFPHTMFRLMLTEQIYRAFMISSGATYHK